MNQWKCGQCTLENQCSVTECAACGLPNEGKVDPRRGRGPVFTVLLVESEKLKSGKVVALNKEKKIVWRLSDVGKVSKLSETELLLETDKEGIVVNKDSGEPIIRFSGKVQNIVTFDK